MGWPRREGAGFDDALRLLILLDLLVELSVHRCQRRIAGWSSVHIFSSGISSRSR
jgi:hypothetical protein